MKDNGESLVLSKVGSHVGSTWSSLEKLVCESGGEISRSRRFSGFSPDQAQGAVKVQIPHKRAISMASTSHTYTRVEDMCWCGRHKRAWCAVALKLVKTRAPNVHQARVATK